ncbi:MAG: tubulin-like doman-containing protein [Pirellulales bacterium]
MDNEITPTRGFNKQEPIPGYITKELLGAGGYGEVWRTLAPGGLVKAVKFIYADANSKHASAELRSLNRIKEVRHPFLLSIERIEVIDGNVVIVTELADHSLKRQFQKQRSKGLPGLPREELLGYLRDAADALDYIYDNYSLQHLDIKPENLLLVGNRAKVADFGMIKNLYDRTSSMVEGLTPTYAPPELFDGKPNRHSDQYSMAIVYQEMLTGDLPFDGTSAAQLAAQHLHMAPALLSLPRADQSIIARALSKDPAQRFPSCRALVEALLEAGKTKATTTDEPLRSRQRATAPAAPLKTQDLGEGSIAALTPEQCFPAKPHSSQRGIELPAIELDDESPAEYEPMLFLGIGGTATHVLRRLRRRLYDRLGPLETIPAIEMVLIDTDIKSLNRATDGEHGSALDGNERLPMPLRRSEDYRSAAGNILASISRRWLFNVPYSLETSGYRPLGRLALIDHSKRLLERLQQSLIKITSDASIAAASEVTGLKFASRQPRIYIIASTAGGTGSGMVIDVAYAVRSILAKLDLPDGNVHGILLHSTPAAQRDRDKAVANTYAALNELWHYSRPGKCYPGDRGCGVPAFHGNNRTFASCYFVHLGDELTELQFDIATDPVAEYLYASTLTPATRFFDKCRQLDYVRWGTEVTEPVLRTFGLCQLGGSNSEIPTVVAELLCRDLAQRWRGVLAADNQQTAKLLSITAALSVMDQETQDARFARIDAEAAAKAVELGVDLEQMRTAARQILDEELSGDAQAYFDKLIVARHGKNEANANAQIIASIDAALTAGDDTALNSVSTALSTRIEGRASKLASAVCDWIFDLVDRQGGVAGAKHAAEWLQSRLRDLQENMLATMTRLREEALARHHAILRGGDEERPTGMRLFARKKQGPDLDTLLRCYAQSQIDQAIACSVTRWLRLVEAQVNAELERLQVFWKDLGLLADRFQVSESLEEAFESRGTAEAVPGGWRDLLRDLIGRRYDLVEALDREMERKLAKGPHKLRWFLNERRPIDIELAAPMLTVARQLILATMQDLNASRMGVDGQSAAGPPDYAHCVETARPALADQAAGMRLLLIVPNDTDAESVRKDLAEHNHSATIVHSAEGDLIACQEGELLEVRRVAQSLIDGRSEFVELAQRLHTRIDVHWDDMAASVASGAFNFVGGNLPRTDYSMSEVSK